NLICPFSQLHGFMKRLVRDAAHRSQEWRQANLLQKQVILLSLSAAAYIFRNAAVVRMNMTSEPYGTGAVLNGCSRSCFS
ncbi:MAG TPA: hypothetical protein PLZ77_09210, partial [Lachnospiraceae bacterium]|nr:hypothetical protein [Lachnospiraceae bacterium]